VHLPSLVYIDDNLLIRDRRRFAPVWQVYPLQTEDFPAFNWEWLSSVGNYSFVQCYETRKAILGEAYLVPDP
jgi:hypothetical protein